LFCCLCVDFIGLLTALHYECVVDDADGLVPVAKLELTDERFHLFSRYFSAPIFLCKVFIFHDVHVFFFRGKIDCELKGAFLDAFKEQLKLSYEGLPLVIIQFGKIVRKEGRF